MFRGCSRETSDLLRAERFRKFGPNSSSVLFDALKKGDYEVWRRRTVEETEAAGHQEMLNSMVLAGAMAELKRKSVIHDYVETYIFQSDKCFCSFPPN